MIAVLTGDLVSSTKMTNQKYTNVISDLERILLYLHEEHQAIGEIYRGDAFQVQFPNPLEALKATLLIKLDLYTSDLSDKPILCTLSLAYGEYGILREKPNTSLGEAFIDSGRKLDKTPRGDMSVYFSQATDNPQIALLTQFLNHLLNRLTQKQAQLLSQYIKNDFTEHKKLAEITGTSRQNISNRLKNIGADLVRDYIKMVNSKIMDNTMG